MGQMELEVELRETASSIIQVVEILTKRHVVMSRNNGQARLRSCFDKHALVERCRTYRKTFAQYRHHDVHLL